MYVIQGNQLFSAHPLDIGHRRDLRIWTTDDFDIIDGVLRYLTGGGANQDNDLATGYLASLNL